MSELLGLENLAIRPDGPTLSLSLAPGQSMAIYGPSGAGKSRFLRAALGLDCPAQGQAHVRGPVSIPSTDLPRRTKLQNLVRQLAKESDLATDLLTALGLWEARHQALGDLTPSQLAAVEVLTALGAHHGLVGFDRQLDALDPWSLARVMVFLRRLSREGVSCLAVTNRPDLASHFDILVVLRNQDVRFAGSCEELLRHGPEAALDVVSTNQAAVRALVEPFGVSVRETPEGLRLQAFEGQDLAARLLVEGYGDVRFVVQRKPTIEESLLALFS